jgi:hypothetical protein
MHDLMENRSPCQTSQVEQREVIQSPNQSFLQSSDGKQSPQSTQSSSPHNTSHDTGYQNSDASFEDSRVGFDMNSY